jgi:hypothetical protein
LGSQKARFRAIESSIGGQGDQGILRWSGPASIR